MHSFYRYFFLCPLVAAVFPGISLANPIPPPDLTRPVSLVDAIRWAIERDPELMVWSTRVEMAAGLVEQSQVRPNPVISAEVENIVGSGPFQGVDGMELTLSISQVLERSEKRSRRTDVAHKRQALFYWERELRIAELESVVRATFVDVLISQEILALRHDQWELAVANRSETAKLVEAARAPTVDLIQAEMAVRQHAFALEQDKRSAEAARERLGLLWGFSQVPDFSIVGELEPGLVPDVDELIAALPTTAAIGRFAAETSYRESALAMAEVTKKPDIEVFGGARYFNESNGDAAFLMGIQVPWPLSDRNNGNIRAARAELRAIEHKRALEERSLMRNLVELHRALSTALADYRGLEQDLRPIAEQAVTEIEAGYERGQFTILAVLESRAALFAIREAQLDSIARYAAALARIESLTRPSSTAR